MSFPETRYSLIQRIAAGVDESAWREFLGDYWGPVCRFALRRGSLQPDDAEDVAGQTFLALVQNRLLARWVLRRSARLRTLLCTVVRHVLANRARVRAGRERLLRELPITVEEEAPPEQVDAFYAAWAEELLQRAVDALLADYHREGRGDHFRVLYGRLCEGLTAAETAAALGLTVSQAENAYKHARARLAARLEELVRGHVRGYCGEEADGEFVAEWAQLGEFLARHGGLEEAIRRAHADPAPAWRQARRAASINATLAALADLARNEAAPGG
jgi:RNA polymerase sigma factor (sigma-70 family)